MTKLIYRSTITLIFISAFLFRCSKEKDTGNQEQQISFAITVPDTKSGSETKGAAAYSLSDAKKIVLTIKNADGSSTKYSSSEVTIYEMNGVFFSEKLMLKAGTYNLTEFLLSDESGNIIFAAPLKGSSESQFVTHPLPLPFNVINSVNSPVEVEVLSTENSTPADFGLVSFQISLVNVIDFLITVADRDNDKLLTAKLTVSIGAYTYVQMLDSVANNRVIVKDSSGIDTYNLTIEKSGYISYSHNYTKDSLKQFNSSGNNTPLLIELERKNLGTLTDIENNVYRTIKIGGQWWMAENLKATRYNDGTSIPYVTDNLAWENLSGPAYCWHNNDTLKNKFIYGALYNWPTISTGKLCPSEWHVPTPSEWTTLINYTIANGYNYDGTTSDNKIGKSLSDTAYWAYSDIPGVVGNIDFPAKRNITGFTALPSGERTMSGFFGDLGYACFWWASPEPNHENGWNFFLLGGASYLGISVGGGGAGYSVRCIKD